MLGAESSVTWTPIGEPIRSMSVRVNARRRNHVRGQEVAIQGTVAIA